MERYKKIEDLFSVKGKSALITGGTKGLGKAIASGLLENQCDVFITSRNINECEDILELAKSMGKKCIPYSCDVTKSGEVKEMVDYALAKLGKIDILINSAGINRIKFVYEMDDESWENVIKTNLNATFFTMREVSKVMIQQRSGKIINMSSMKGFLGTSDFGYSAYCATKGAVNMLTKQAACELAKYNITCNAIAPTFIKTDINAAMLEDPVFRKNLEARIPLGRIGELNDIVNMALFLSSEASSFITGQIIPLDGGILARQ